MRCDSYPITLIHSEQLVGLEPTPAGPTLQGTCVLGIGVASKTDYSGLISQGPHPWDLIHSNTTSHRSPPLRIDYW